MSDGRNSDLHYYKCADCALWNYDIGLGMDQSQYTERYVSPLDPDHKSNKDVAQSWRFLQPHLGEVGSMMDIGCGNACLLHLARADGWKVRGMELSESTAKSIRDDQGIDVAVANFLDYENPDEQRYDVVVLRHVLEHLPDSVLAMQKIAALLKPGGLALLEFPNTRSFSYAIKRLLKNRGMRNRKYSDDWRPGHCNEFCRQSFEVLLNKTGFELVVWQTYSSKPLANAFYRLFPIASKARALVRYRP
tara:strand:- start:266 stop:1009 length:744 start_codon:yes stop_codon:yes gene_type:complete